MRKKIIRQFAVGTCSVCFAYALTADSISALLNPNDDVQVVDATAAAAATAEMTEDITTSVAAAEVWPYNAPMEDTADGRGKHGRDTTYTEDASVTAALPTVEAVAVEENTTDSETQTAVVEANASGGEQTTAVSSQTDTSGTPPTLSQYLSALRCGGCRHNCLLVSPRCMKGRTKAQSATVEYYETYGE